jgi:hypothetical protein
MTLATTILAFAFSTAAVESQAYPLPAAERQELRRQLEEMNAAARRGDDARVLKYLHEAVVQGLGGPAAALQSMARVREQMKADGAEIQRSDVSDAPPPCVRSADRIQCVVAGAQYLRMTGTTYLGATQTLAFSSDGGKRWTFASVVDPDALRAQLPEVSRDLPLKKMPPPIAVDDPAGERPKAPAPRDPGTF